MTGMSREGFMEEEDVEKHPEAWIGYTDPPRRIPTPLPSPNPYSYISTLKLPKRSPMQGIPVPPLLATVLPKWAVSPVLKEH